MILFITRSLENILHRFTTLNNIYIAIYFLESENMHSFMNFLKNNIFLNTWYLRRAFK